MEKYHHTPVRDYKHIATFAGKNDFPVQPLDEEQIIKRPEFIEKKLATPGESEIRAILQQMGKTDKKDELNCGSCGDDTCREKAIAIYQGKADLTMCLPYLKERAESFNNTVLNNTENGILVLNEDLEVQQINKAACRIMNIRSAGDVLGEQLIRIMDPTDFLEVKSTVRRLERKCLYLAEYDKYVDKTITYDKEFRVLMCFMRYITDEQRERQKKKELSRKTVDIADKVVDKQMRIVQEIASLLGETAAETKIALQKLKEQVEDE